LLAGGTVFIASPTVNVNGATILRQSATSASKTWPNLGYFRDVIMIHSYFEDQINKRTKKLATTIKVTSHSD